MPSTASRNPCTKCWRDCSPSDTTSMPASSCSFSQRSVASRLPSASAPPSSFQRGQSLCVSASQAGLGRLPAMVVSNMALYPRLEDVFVRRLGVHHVHALELDAEAVLGPLQVMAVRAREVPQLVATELDHACGWVTRFMRTVIRSRSSAKIDGTPSHVV